jgi:hypothetical protein
MLKNFVISFLSLTFILNVKGQTDKIAPKYSNEFLQIGLGADAMGRSNAVVASIDNANAGYWNPAGLTKVNKWLEISAMHSEYFAGIAKYDYLGLAKSIDSTSAMGFSFIRFGVDDIPNTTQLIDNAGRIDYDKITTFTAADYAFLFSYARKMPIKGLSVGGNFKIIHRKVGDFAKSWGFGIDAGAQYQQGKHWKHGIMVRDVTSTFNAWIFDLDDQTKEVFTKTGNELPQNGLEVTLPRILLGSQGKYDLGKKGIYVASEVDLALTMDGKRNVLIKSKPFSIDPYLGVQFGYKSLVQLRMGIGNIQKIKDFDDKETFKVQPNIGFGLNIKNFYLDYAFTNFDQSVGLYSHVISLRIKLNKPEPKI